MEIRTIETQELEVAGGLLFQATAAAAQAGGHPSWWKEERDAIHVLARDCEVDPSSVVVATEGGAIIGVSSMRVRGDVACLGPMAVAADGRGIGGALVDELLERADVAGARSTRLHVDAWNSAAYALYAGRGFQVVDVAFRAARTLEDPPAVGTARGLEVRAVREDDFDPIYRLDCKLTGYSRQAELKSLVKLVAFRHGVVVGYAGMTAGVIGPVLTIDAQDLHTLVAHALLMNPEGKTEVRVSTAAPATAMSLMSLGFRVSALGIILSRGALPPARPPQLYCMDPEFV